MNAVRNRLAVILMVAALGCSDDGTPTDGPEGVYTATVLTVSTDGGTSDLLAAGAELAITLTASGTTTGTLVVPAAFTESGNEETFSLAGTYDYDPATGAVTFDQSADTFIRDASWSLSADQLHGVFDNGTSSVTATLAR